ncbi:YdcF family protein [Terracidiphilus gabretensis]|uniref:YdcF family protein n=1 Tax=Terracidiphilus gabretensis TaxID=1577687 RepID=UPI00071BF6CF|nr:YdcF family protein [Terracidiphilus gabretensis]
MTPQPRQLARQAPKRRPSRRGTARRGFQPRFLRWIALGALAVVVFLVWAVLARVFAPKSNTAATHFDAIIVLGYPADNDGNPTPEQLARVTEGVHEYERGVAPRLILTGGSAHNHIIEAESMARVARAQGVPQSAIVLEPRALSTIDNACYSARIMKQNGWRSAEVITSNYHLPRAGIIFNNLPHELAIDWRGHGAPELGPDPEPAPGWAVTSSEVTKTVRYLLYARWADSCSP